jgi:DNA mismatch endonuclease, patch repair protein
MQSNRSTDTGPERALRSALHRAGLRFRKDYRVRVGDLAVRIDIAFPRQRLAVFVDGCFWHRCPEHATDPRAHRDFWAAKLHGNVERDRRVNAALGAAGWRVLRVWEHESSIEAAARVRTSIEFGRTT